MTARRTPALDRARAWAGAHVRSVDALTALGWTGVASLFAPTAVLTSVPLTPWIVITVLCGLVLAARRTAPEATVASLGVLMVAHVLVIHAFTVTAAVAVFSAAYTAHSLLGPRWRRWATVAMLAGTAWAALSYSREVIDLAWYLRGPIVLAHWVPVGFFCLLGALARRRREDVERLAERARLLERQRAREIELATLAERNHIARELHDIVAHSLGVIIAQADGGRYAAAADPAAARQALGTIADVARTSLTQMRSLLAVLRSEEPRGVAPAPGLADLPALFEEYRAAGLGVRVHVNGEPAQVTGAQGLAIHRLVQESLANALRHAGQVPVRAELNWEPGLLTVTVTSPLRVAPGPDASAGPDRAEPAPGPGASAGQDAAGRAGPGHGLLGMRERMALHGGTVEAGPRGSTWLVRATMPLSAPAGQGAGTLPGEDA